LTGQKLTGGFWANYKPIEGIKSLVSKHLSAKLNLDQFITHRLSLDEVNKRIQLMKNGESIRSVITFNSNQLNNNF
jgi:S-(hydroxymethyl)glutathione dehydrogenase/alcohol dehydrogenase